MKITGIVGSPRGEASQTLRLARAFAEGARAKGAQVELVDVCILRINYCRACDVCHRTGRCIHADDFAPLWNKIADSEGVMMASPDYFRSVTGQMKTMIDRMATVIHCQLLAGKYACSLATSGGPEGGEVTSYLNGVMESMGAVVVGGVYAAMSAGPAAFSEAEARARELGALLVEWVQVKRDDPEQKIRRDRTAAYFRALVERNRERWKYEYSYWQSQGK